MSELFIPGINKTFTGNNSSLGTVAMTIDKMWIVIIKLKAGLAER